MNWLFRQGQQQYSEGHMAGMCAPNKTMYFPLDFYFEGAKKDKGSIHF